MKPSNADEEAIDVYTNGNCGFLATVLAKKYGWKLVMFLADDNWDDVPNYIHCFCEREDGKLVDISGLWDNLAELKADWKPSGQAYGKGHRLHVHKLDKVGASLFDFAHQYTPVEIVDGWLGDKDDNRDFVAMFRRHAEEYWASNKKYFDSLAKEAGK